MIRVGLIEKVRWKGSERGSTVAIGRGFQTGEQPLQMP